MSRPVAGVRNKTLILTLPGSPKGAKENLQAVLKLLPHACVQAAGADSRSLHAGGVKKLEKEAGIEAGPSSVVGDANRGARGGHHHGPGHAHSHGHAHGRGGHVGAVARTDPEAQHRSNDPSQGPTQRSRASPWPMLSVEDASGLIAEKMPPPTVVRAAVTPRLVGSVLAEDVTATEAVPAYRASIVDGYAVVLSSGQGGRGSKGVFPVVSVSHAAPGEIPALKEGQIARITTGAPLPPGATSVVMVEDTVLKSMTDDGQEEKEVEILTADIKPGENVREIGSDIQAGDIILRKGEGISAVGGELGLLASVGKAEVAIYKKPAVGVLSTGDEVVQHDRAGPLRAGEVRDCNRPTLMAAIQGWGFDVVDLGVVGDTYYTNKKLELDSRGALETVLRRSLRQVDVIVTSGGVSMGELDLLKPTIERSLGGTIHFGRVAMKPGKPTTFATVPFKASDGTRAPAAPGHTTRAVFSLPGNPASAVVTAHLFVLPALHRLAGVAPVGLPRVRVTLAHDVPLDPHRREYHRAVVSAAAPAAAAAAASAEHDEPDGRLYASSTGFQRSSRVGSFRGANALLCLPAREGVLRKGERVEALLMGRLVG
ncbi:MAG: hypothetical protein M1819_001455 [Sarea resinae]|nr:MAG: hypothetical protein M1819_001455 [Sarea resinae]